MSKPVVRLTFFKIANAEDQDFAVEQYKDIQKEALKNGTPYLFANSTSKLHADPRSQGYTVATRTIFHSMDDLVYYDTECARHATIKSALKEKLAEPPLVVYMDANPLEAARMISMLKSTYGDSGTEGEGAKPEGA